MAESLEPSAGHEDRTETFVRLESLAPSLAALHALLSRPRNYEATELHAQGGMGAILRTRDRNVDRTVAMKVMNRSTQTPGLVLRFIDEARITGRLEHPNIVPVHEAGLNERGEVFYTMKFVKGTTLKEVLRRLLDGDVAMRKQYPLAALLTAFQKVCDAVAFAHSRNVIHRDLKPENIMLGDFGEVLVMDWGLAKVLRTTEDTDKERRSEAEDGNLSVPPSPHVSGSSPLSASSSLITSARDESGDSATRAGTVLGTPRYMAPEQAAGDVEHMDGRTDIYALGAILHEILALRPAIAGKTAEEIIANVLAGNIQPLTTKATRASGPRERAGSPSHTVPESLAAVARKALALKPADRYPSVPALQAEIIRYQTGFATTAENAGFTKQLALLVKRNKGIVLTAAAAWLVITALAVWFFVNIAQERDRAKAALANLKATAPTFLEQAKSLVGAQKFTDALAMTDTAIALDDQHAGFHALRGNLLQTLRRFDEAADSYRTSRSLDPAQPFVDENIALSDRLWKAQQGGHTLAPEELRNFLVALRAQERASEALPLSAELLESAAAQFPLVQQRIKQWLGRSPPDLSLAPIRRISLSLRQLPLTDITPLRGLPISSLDLASTRVTNLEALKGMKLYEFGYTSGADIHDLEVFRGMPLAAFSLYNRSVTDISPVANPDLQDLAITGCRVIDISCLKGCPLERLELNRTGVRDYAPLAGTKLRTLSVSEHFDNPSVLKGMPLRRLSLAGAKAITNIEFVATFTQLEELVLPPSPGRIDFLRKQPNLRFLAASEKSNGWDTETTTTQFWAEYDAQQQKK